MGWFEAPSLSGALLLHRVRVSRLLELERVRSRIAADLHDDIGASLTQVAVLSEVAHRRAHDVATVQRHTEKIAVICRELAATTSDIVWAVSPRHESVDDLVQRMRSFAGELLDAQGIAFHFDCAAGESGSRLAPDVRRNVYLIFKEALNNVARHSGATAVRVRLAVDRTWVQMTIADNGRGLGSVAANGNGLLNMRRRASGVGGICEVKTGEAGGVAVCLQLPRDGTGRGTHH